MEKKNDNETFPVVGIGASAGGLQAFESFFNGMSPDSNPGMAFVLVQHLSPDYKSILTEIIRTYTQMSVCEIEEGMLIEANNIYIKPSNKNIALIKGRFHLSDVTHPRGHNLPIDFFFNTLANDFEKRAIGIILSGNGADGTIGLKAIKDKGGLVIVQTPESAAYDGMPTSAIESGVVDDQLEPDEMINCMISRLMDRESSLANASQSDIQDDSSVISIIFALLKSQIGHDFSGYKPQTIKRRIERRIFDLNLQTFSDYLKVLQKEPLEIEKLFKDLLIGVTSFFRDKEAYEAIEALMPTLFENKQSDLVIRVWCAGCSTGEEAYSIAILMHEYLERAMSNCAIQIFATDIDAQAIELSRAGVYSNSIIEDLTAERIKRFFTVEAGGSAYRICKAIREMIIFSEQSLIKDPPFSKVDLITCRNLMIYLNSDLQKKIIPLFHYALNPNGILFLGSSETVGDHENLFKAMDRKLKIYQKIDDDRGNQRLALSQLLMSNSGIPSNATVSKSRYQHIHSTMQSMAEQAIIKESLMSGALVNASGDIFYFHGRTGLFLEPAPGESGINNILKMATEGLKHILSATLQKAEFTNETQKVQDIFIKKNGKISKVNLIIKPLPTKSTLESSKILYMVIFEPSKENSTKLQLSSNGQFNENNSSIEDLKIELRIKEESLQTMIEQLETANEELKSMNEELQSTNEELQSTNEELETSKEELQSINEELTTVNSELQTKIHELYQLNNDMNNLLSGTNIATIFLDCNRNIMRFTPTATEIVNMIPSDVGRPITHLVTNLVDYNALGTDVQYVLDTLEMKISHERTVEGKWYKMIIQPYRTIENVVEGVVITFTDITDSKLARDKLAISEKSFRILFETAGEGILIVDLATGMILKANPYLTNLLGYLESEMQSMKIWDIGLFDHNKLAESNFLVSDIKALMSVRSLPLRTKKGEEIQVESIGNVFEVENQKIIQCNIRAVL